MKYGFFDESKKEYVITRPDTPAPWVNYLGSPEYGAIISNNAGGYSFAKSEHINIQNKNSKYQIRDMTKRTYFTPVSARLYNILISC